MEIDRRNSGKEAQETIKRIKETKNLREVEEIKSEKKEEMLAKKKIREQIEADKRERKKKFEIQKDTPSNNSGMSSSVTIISSDSTAKIAFRLLDGSTATAQFKLSDKLVILRDHIDRTYNYRKFIMLCPFPRHTYTEVEMNMSLQQLQLYPTATIIISSPDTPPSPSSQQANVPSLLQTIYGYASSLVSTVIGYIWTQPTTQPQLPNTSPQLPSTAPQVRSNETSNRLTRGNNIRSLNRGDDQDANKNATWNGNSTQQQ